MIKKSPKDTKASKIEDSLRSFIKKAVYTTPKIIALGLLTATKPSAAFDGPPDAPSNSGKPWV